MIIDSNSGIYSSGGGAKTKAPTAGATENSQGKSAPAVSPEKRSVSLSNEAHTLSRLEAQINAAPDIDASRIAEIKQAIAEGTFEINAEKIAEKMLGQDDLLDS